MQRSTQHKQIVTIDWSFQVRRDRRAISRHEAHVVHTKQLVIHAYVVDRCGPVDR